MVKPLKVKDVPLSGKVVTSRDAATIGHDFQQLTNLRYTDTHPEGVVGMTEVNATALTNAKIRSGFHYRKEQPAESHVLVQSQNAGETASYIYDNEAVVPAQSAFTATAVLTQASGYDTARFSTAPNHNMAMCDKSGAYVWGGDEKLCAAFITSTATITDSITNPRDYTEEVTNTLSTSAEVALVGGGSDSDTKLLMHFDEADTGTDFDDSSDSSHNPAGGGGDEQVDSDQKKFGIGSLLLDGTGDFVEVADHADWNFGTGLLTIDAWVRPKNAAALSTGMGVICQSDAVYAATDRFSLYINSAGILVQVVSSSSQILYFYYQSAGTLVVDTWYHIALVRGWGGNANDWALCIDGTAVGTATASITMPDLGGTLRIGQHCGAADYDLYYYGWIDELRVSKGVARWVANFTPPTQAYSSVAITWIVGATRPLKGVKFYIGNANSQASTMTVKEWNGVSWTALTVTDNTDTGASLATTGTVTWDTTESSSKIKYLYGLALYWYQFSIDAGEATIYHCTVDAAMQPVKDIWDGVDRAITSFQVYDSTAGELKYRDYTLNVYSDDYDSLNTGTYAEIDDLIATTTEWFIVGFSERMMGINFSFVSDKGNITAATTASVYYWTGSAWASLSGVTDGTINDSKSMAQSGVVSWQPPEKGEEFKQEISNYPPFYYYKFDFDKAMSGDVQIYYITGVPAQKTINSYSFPLHGMNSLWLCSEQDGDKNKMIRSLAGTASTYNGMGYEEFRLGDETELMAGAVIYAQFNSNLYEMIVVCKKSKTFILVPLAEGVKEFKVADHIGCVAPGTMRSLNMGDTEEGNRNVCIWQGAEGIYAFEGRSPVRISDDIQDIFDKNNSSGMNRSYPHVSYGFFDIENYCYHWVYASGTATVPDDEWVYDIKRKRWFQINRGTGNDLMGGIEVESTFGVPYSYGFDNSGQVYRLNYGTDFDGADIVHTLHTGVFPVEPTTMVETKLRKINLVCKATNTTTNTITASMYRDGSTTANTDTATLVPQASGKTIAQTKTNIHSDAVFHSVKMVMTTDDETVGFEPMYLGLSYRPIRMV